MNILWYQWHSTNII